ncbi:MAG: hypothetical protein KY464_13640 [Gemmatimonadetes bacterium]|nr:hypothetical protein [Gemmatimonadota bacterium]
MSRRWIAALGLAGLVSVAACGGEEGAGADGSADDMGSDSTMTTDGTGIAGQGGRNDTVGMGQGGAAGQSVPSDTGGFGAGGIGGAGTGTTGAGQ